MGQPGSGCMKGHSSLTTMMDGGTLVGVGVRVRVGVGVLVGEAVAVGVGVVRHFPKRFAW
jgi:hypothetical protein